MNILQASQEDAAHIDDLSERDILLLELLNSRGTMTVSEIAAAYLNVSTITISTNIIKR